jgi:peptidyl-tRNA hydrolase, PTH2 family
MEYKQVIIIRKDLNMRKGKCVAQGAHASLGAYLEALAQVPATANVWLSGLQTKICVGVSREQELQTAYTRAAHVGLPISIITDAGKTEFGGVPTKTAVAIGPGPVEEIDAITREMSLL